MIQDEEKYAAASRELLEKAQEALTEGDLRQASEKGWGAAAQIAKAVAARRGWQHQSHADLFTAVRQLATETEDNRLRELMNAANGLHYNFYENWLPADLVQTGLDQVREFVQRMERFLEDQS